MATPKRHFKDKRKKAKVQTVRVVPARRRAPRGVGRWAGFPRQKTVKLNYVSSITLNPVVGGMAQWFFSANGIYDPDITGIGHQPYLRDTWSALYNHYVISRSSMKCTFVRDADDSPTVPCMVGCVIADDTTIPVDYYTLMEGRRGTVKLLPSSADVQRSTNTSFNAKKFFTVSDVNDNQNRIGAAVGTNPDPAKQQDQAYYCVFAQTMDQTATTPVLNVLIEMTYTVTYSEPKDVAGS